MSKATETPVDVKTADIVGKEGKVKVAFVGAKQGGANSAGEHGGIYEDQQGQKYLLKADKPEKDIAEFLAAAIFEQTAPKHSARVHLAKAVDGTTYIASQFVEQYTDLFKTVKQKGAPTKDGRTFGAGIVNKFTGFIHKGMLKEDGSSKYKGFPEVMATSLLTGDFDVHTGNIGLSGTADQKENGGANLVRIDYAAAFKNLDAKVHPHSVSRHPFGRGPTNHFREFPRVLRVSHEFADHAFKIANEKLGPTIDEAFEKIKENFEVGDIKKFGIRLGMDKRLLKGVDDKAVIRVMVAGHVKKTMKERQESMRQFGLEIGLSLCFDKEGKFRDVKQKNGNIIPGKKYFEELMSDEKNRKILGAVARGEKHLHLRDKGGIMKPLQKFLNNRGLMKFRSSYKRQENIRGKLEFALAEETREKAAESRGHDLEDLPKEASRDKDQSAQCPLAHAENSRRAHTTNAVKRKAPGGYARAATMARRQQTQAGMVR